VINSAHKEVVLGALDAGKHVLCEKPMGLNVKEVKEMVEKAKQAKRFLMEAFWTRFFPSTQLLLAELEEIGDVKLVEAEFGWPIEPVNKCELRLGGGYLMATGCYTILFASLVMGGKKKPVRVKASGGLGALKTDMWASVVLEYENGCVANLFYTGEVQSACRAAISGTKGRLIIPDNFWSPTQLVKETLVNTTEPLIPTYHSVSRHFLTPDQTVSKSKFTYPTMAGLVYEVHHVYECLRDGKLESDQITHADSVAWAEVFEEVRRQLGVHYPQD